MAANSLQENWMALVLLHFGLSDSRFCSMIGFYAQWLKVALAEAGKYFLLLVVAVLAIRCWRRAVHAPGAAKARSMLMAATISAAAFAVGYFSIMHSLGLLYLQFGVRAYEANRFQSALGLVQISNSYWKSADALLASARSKVLRVMAAVG